MGGENVGQYPGPEVAGNQGLKEVMTGMMGRLEAKHNELGGNLYRKVGGKRGSVAFILPTPLSRQLSEPSGSKMVTEYLAITPGGFKLLQFEQGQAGAEYAKGVFESSLAANSLDEYGGYGEQPWHDLFTKRGFTGEMLQIHRATFFNDGVMVGPQRIKRAGESAKMIGTVDEEIISALLNINLDRARVAHEEQQTEQAERDRIQQLSQEEVAQTHRQLVQGIDRLLG